MNMANIITYAAESLSWGSLSLAARYYFFIFRHIYLVTRLVLSVKSFTLCSTFHTACDIGDGLIFLRRFFPQKRRLLPKFFVHHCLYAEVSLLSFSKREFHLAACAFEKPASFRTQLSTYSRRFITSVEHENSGEHEISDLSTDLSLSLSTVYNLGPRR